MSIIYEWIAEERDPNGEITETSVWPTRADAIACAAETPGTRVALVRDHPDDGRAWAYCGRDGTLPTAFRDASGHEIVPVPKRFRR